jgi:hypothetical protein
MSSMLEQAIVDAAALREAALKNAEQSLIEKYAPQIKEAVEAMLEDAPSKMKYEGRVVDVVHEVDSSGNVTVSEAGGKPFVVSESELSDLSESDILQEEEMDMSGGTGVESPSDSITAPFAANPTTAPETPVSLNIDVESLEGDLEIDLLQLEKEMEDELDGATADEGDFNSIEDMALDLGDEEEVLGGDEEDTQLEELLNILSEYNTETLDEEIGPGGPTGGAQKAGWVTTASFQNEEEQDYQEIADNLYPEEQEDEAEDDEDNEEGYPEAGRQLEETIDLLMTQNQKLESIVYNLSDKLEETLLSNAILLYQNRTLCDASLNERQKDKIVEAIAKAESPKEAKHLCETLRTTVGAKSEKAPKSLTETVNRRSNLSGIINRRQNLNESQASDPFFNKMKKLAGIK